MARVTCPRCSAKIDSSKLEDHIAESHSDPDVKVDGVVEADFIRRAVESGAHQPVGELPEDTTEIPAFGVLEELGVSSSSVANATLTTEAGGALSSTEAKRVMSAVEKYLGWRYDRGSFIVNFIDWGIRTSFSEELAEAGGFTIISDPTIARQERYVKMIDLHAAITDSLADAGTGRQFTFRRMGRYLAKAIPRIVGENKQLSRYFTEGSPMSNHLGIAPVNFLTCTSIFEYIKPYSKWTADERSAWVAHNRAVVKVANTSNEAFLPADLRPSPSQAQTLIDGGANDFGRRHAPDYGKGRNLFERMLSGARASTDRTGMGF